MTDRPSTRRKTPPPCSWCGAPTPSETTFNGHTIPLCRTCIDRLSRARREPKHRYMLRALDLKFPPREGEAAEGGSGDRRQRRDRRQPDTRRAPSSRGSTRDGSAPAKGDDRQHAPLDADARAAVRREAVRARREVAAALGALDAGDRDRLPETPSVTELQAEVRAAVQAGDRKQAELAIAKWRRDWLARFEEARWA